MSTGVTSHAKKRRVHLQLATATQLISSLDLAYQAMNIETLVILVTFYANLSTGACAEIFWQSQCCLTLH